MLYDCIEEVEIVLRGNWEFEAKSVFHDKWGLEEGPPRVGGSQRTSDLEDDTVNLLS